MKPTLGGHVKRWIVVYILLIALAVTAADKIPLPKLDPALRQELADYLKTHLLTPEQYVLGKFADHDVVFLGEYHRIKQNLELVQRLIPLLPQHGVGYLGYEFARREDQPLIDSLLAAPVYDEALARRILFQGFVFWGYQEYADVFRAAWKYNHSVADTARKLRILGLNDSPDWSFVKTQADRDKHEIMSKVWRGGSEEKWANVILDSVIARGEKALVYCGIHHAFTEFQQPIVDGQGKFIRFETERAGNFVYRKIGKRAITVYLHAPWPAREGYDVPSVYPVDGVIDALMADLGPMIYPIAFDTRGTPFGKLPGQTGIYSHGYDPFTLERFCGGYIFQMPVSQYTGVTPIPDFVNESNVETARLQSPNPAFRQTSIEDFNKAIAADADMVRRFQSLR
jgi:hypothetical protein